MSSGIKQQGLIFSFSPRSSTQRPGMESTLVSTPTFSEYIPTSRKQNSSPMLPRKTRKIFSHDDSHKIYKLMINQQEKVRENWVCLSLLFRSKLFREYRLKLPNNQSTEIVAAFLISGKLCEGSISIKGENCQVVLVEDVQKFIQAVGIHKLMQKFKNQQKSRKILNCFDVIVVAVQNRYTFGVLPWQFTEQLISKIFEEDRVKIKRQIENQMVDFHCNNIVFGEILPEQIRWAQQTKQTVLEPSQKISILKHSEGHLFWMQQKMDPYQADLVRIDEVLNQLPNQSSSIQHVPNQIVKDIQVLSLLYSQKYSIFCKRYQEAFKQSFSIFRNIDFSMGIKQYYQKNGQKEDLHSFLSQYIAQARPQGWQQVIELQKVIRQQKYLAGLIAPLGRSTSFNIFQEIKRHQQQHIKTLAQYEGLDCKKDLPSLQKILNKIEKKNDQERMLWHFLQAKIASQKSLFYKALSHLKQSLRFATDSHETSSIELEKGRNWEYLCDSDQAETCYRRSLALRIDNFGSRHILVATPLYNILLLKIKQNQREQVKLLKKQLDDVLNKYEIKQIKGCSQLIFSPLVEQVLSSFDKRLSERKSEKMPKNISKEELIKIQALITPAIEGSWKQLKLSFQKNSSPDCKLKNHFQTYLDVPILFAQLCKAAFNKTSLACETIYLIQRAMWRMKISNKKNYNRFLFMSSLYWENQDYFHTASKHMKQLLQISEEEYPQNIKKSLRMNYISILKKGNFKTEIFSYYNSLDFDQCSPDIILEGIQFLFENQEYSKVIKILTSYLKKTTTEQKIRQMKIYLVKSYRRINHFQEAQSLLATLKLSEKQTKLIFKESEISPEQSYNEEVSIEKMIISKWTQKRSQNKKFRSIEEFINNSSNKENKIDLISSLIFKIATIQGKRSELIICLHLLLLNICQYQNRPYFQLLILLWLHNFKQNLPLEISSFWTTKQGRDGRLDHLFYRFISEGLPSAEPESQSFKDLWWFDQTKSEVNDLKDRFKRIADLQRIQKLSDWTISDFKIKYVSYFTSELKTSQVLAQLDLIANELDIPLDEQL